MNRLHTTPWSLAGEAIPPGGLELCMMAVAAVEEEWAEERQRRAAARSRRR